MTVEELYLFAKVRGVEKWELKVYDNEHEYPGSILDVRVEDEYVALM